MRGLGALLVLIVAAAASQLAAAAAQPASSSTNIAADARLVACGASIQGNSVLRAFELARPDLVWNVLPAMGMAPELIDAAGPALVVVFDGEYSAPWSDDSGKQARVAEAVCVVDAEGTANIYFNVSRQGMTLPE